VTDGQTDGIAVASTELAMRRAVINNKIIIFVILTGIDEHIKEIVY